MPDRITPEDLARFFHDEYERMAPAFGYETRQDTAVPWERLLDANKQLMCAVAASVLLRFFPERMMVEHERSTSSNSSSPVTPMPTSDTPAG